MDNSTSGRYRVQLLGSGCVMIDVFRLRAIARREIHREVVNTFMSLLMLTECPNPYASRLKREKMKCNDPRDFALLFSTAFMWRIGTATGTRVRRPIIVRKWEHHDPLARDQQYRCGCTGIKRMAWETLQHKLNLIP